MIEKRVVIRDPKTKMIETLISSNESEIRHFVSKLYSTIEAVDREMKSFIVKVEGQDLQAKPDIGSYLTFDVPIPPTDDEQN